MRLNDNNTFIGINPPYQLSVIHSSKLIYPREIYQRGVERKRVELIARDFNEYIVNEPKVSFRNGRYYVMDFSSKVSSANAIVNIFPENAKV